MFAAAGRDLDQLQRAVGLDREDRDALVAAVGGVNEFAVGVDADLGGTVGVGDDEAGGQGGDMLDGCGSAARGVVGADADRAVDFVQDVEEAPVAGELGVARPGAGRGGDECRVVWRECAGQEVEPVDKDAIEAEVGDQGETVVRRNGDGVRV